jgi:uncharacterized protein YecT (DUF1311 family)
MQIDEESRQIGREIKKYLAVNRISREQFCHETKLGKSTVDKLIVGIFSDATLQIVLERTNFVRSNSFAAKSLGAYAKSAWAGYLASYLFLHPALSGNGALEALRVSIEWDDKLPGMVLVDRPAKEPTAEPAAVPIPLQQYQPQPKPPLSNPTQLRPRTVEKPSFDCTKANAPIERLLCADADLAVWDGRMGQLYSQGLRNRNIQEALVRTQRDWRRNRDLNCNVPQAGNWSAADMSAAKPCILEKLKRRVDELSKSQPLSSRRQ